MSTDGDKQPETFFTRVKRWFRTIGEKLRFSPSPPEPEIEEEQIPPPAKEKRAEPTPVSIPPQRKPPPPEPPPDTVREVEITGDDFWIKELELTNFKCFDKESFQFPHQFTVLIGDNGSGKTAILEALSIGIGAFFLGIDGAEKAPPITADQVRFAQYEIGQTLTYEPQYPVSVRCTGMGGGREIRWERTRKGVDTSAEGHVAELTDLAATLQRRVRRGGREKLPNIAYYGTGRLWRLSEEQLLDADQPGSRFIGYDQCLNPASHIDSLIQWMRTQELIALQEGRPNKVLQVVKRAITDCVEGLESVSYNVRQGDLLVTFDDTFTSNDTRTLPLRLLSEGFRNMLALVADIAHRAAVLNPHLEENAARETPGIVLIDEIDLHLHPKWQRRVVEDFRRTFPRMQFIATTHSPFIIQSLRRGELIDLNEGRSGKYVNRSIEDIVEDVMRIALPQRSQRYQRMYEAAKEYYRVLERAEGASPQEIDRLKQELDKLVKPFSDNVGYHAFLQMQRIAAGLGDDDDETN